MLQQLWCPESHLPITTTESHLPITTNKHFMYVSAHDAFVYSRHQALAPRSGPFNWQPPQFPLAFWFRGSLVQALRLRI